MMNWGNGIGGFGMLLMIFGNLLLWGLIIAGVVMLVRYLVGTGPSRAPAAGEGPSPRQLLAERFARGEIDEEEYTRRLRVLDTTPPPVPAGR